MHIHMYTSGCCWPINCNSNWEIRSVTKPCDTIQPNLFGKTVELIMNSNV